MDGDEATPMAPPPPPPPPPPSPPPPPAICGYSKLRTYNWEAIPQHTVLGKHNIWTAESRDYELDTAHMEELFRLGKVQNQASIRRRYNAQGPEVVSILNSKKNMNIGIFLKQFRRPMSDIVEDIVRGQSEKFGTGKLKDLCKLLPEDGEVKQLLAFKGDHSALSEADLFMVHLVNVPSYEERLQSLVLKEEFPQVMDEVNHCIATMTTAAKELLECVDLHRIIRLVLKTGNYMNAGGYAGSAIGFRIASLLKLEDTKANKLGMNLMHYVVMQAQKIDVALLKFPEQLQHIGDAARIHKQEIETQFQKEVKKVQEVSVDASKQQEQMEDWQMEDFLKHAQAHLAETEASLQTLNSLTKSVAEYFCEDPGQFKLEECFSIFHSFCEKFMRAIQENRVRKAVELQQQQWQRAKRHSTATCSIMDDKGVALQSMLQRSLDNHGSSRRWTRSAWTPSPTSSSLTEITSQESRRAERSPAADARRNWAKATEEQRNGWVSARELSWGSRERLVNTEEDVERAKVLHSDDAQTPKKAENRSSTNLSERTGSRSEAGLAEDGDDGEDGEGQGEKEAEKLREVSRRVLHFQSHGNALDAQRLPGGAAASPRQRAFQEDQQRLLSEPAGEHGTKPAISPAQRAGGPAQ